MNRSLYMKLKGFTLIELLVVIAIIALLLAVIVPALNKAKEAAMTVVCKTNLKAYGQVGALYLQDNDNYFPNPWESIFRADAPRECQWHDASRSPDKRPDLAGQLIPYLSTKEDINLCPVFERVAFIYGKEHKGPGTVCTIPIEPRYSYSMNVYLAPRTSATTQKRIGDVRIPARTFFFSEENIWTTLKRNRVTLNDNSLVAIWENNSVVEDAPLDFGPESGRNELFQDSFASFHKTNLDEDHRNDGVAVAVFLDSHVEIVRWQDSWRLSKTR